ncbi:MAG: hypothetical protein IT480_11875 [Gammaproteobacteria bacterium]|nr:hypothetical protein [Gammaproteobacteria bacterium]
MRRLAVGIAYLAAAVAQAAPPPDAAPRNFVACPIVRDTASVPCWLAEYQGELYFLTLQTDVSAPVNPPWLGHRVLVEGRRKPGPRICGGVVLEPVRLSIIAEPDPSCNTMLPAEERYNLGFEPPRPPGPSAGRLAFNTLPMPVRPGDVTREVRRYSLSYDFDGLVNFKHPFQLTPVFYMAQAMQARRVEIEGHRGAALLSDGTVLQEQANLAQRRAEQIAELLRDAGLTAPEYAIRWVEAAPPPNGSGDHAQRRVDITLWP